MIAIFVESAILSTVAKFVQLAISSNVVPLNVIVIPLCTLAYNLIVLREIFGSDVTHLQSRTLQELSTLRLNSSEGDRSTNFVNGGDLEGALSTGLLKSSPHTAT